MSKELKKEKLYLLEIEYELESEEGIKSTVKSLLVGYVIGKEDAFFYGSVFDKLEDGGITGGDTMYLSVYEFEDWVKSIKEIA